MREEELMRVIVMLLLAIMIPGSGFAAPAAAVQNACRSDKMRFCYGTGRGTPDARACMARHRSQLSVACRLAIADRALSRRTAKTAKKSR